MYPPPGYHSGRATPNTPHSPFNTAAETALLHQMPQSRPVTNYLDINIPTSGGDGPSDLEINQAVTDLLRTADLNSVTKRGIRQQLEQRFGMDLTARKATINASIDRALLSLN